MASGVDLETASDIRTLYVAHFIGLAFFYYDYLITVGDEIDFVWRRRKSQSAYWFIINRYLAFFANIAVTALRSSPLSEKSCRNFNWFRQITLIANQVIVCLILTIRLYALYGRSRRILGFMVGAGAVLLSVSIYSATGQSNSHLASHSGCHIGFSTKTSIRLAIPWEALFAYDTIVFILTISRSFKLRSKRRVLFSTSIPLVQLVVRDGAVYFAIMAMANLANILTFYICRPYMRGGLSTFSNCISITMISRLMLNLHRSAAQGIFTTQDSNDSDTSTRTGMLFTSRIDTGISSGASEGDFEMRDMMACSEEANLRSPTLV